jgi:alkylation response protein AidB-like acyl-CoA dehydrogenase
VIDLVPDPEQLEVARAARQALAVSTGKSMSDLAGEQLAQLAGAGLFGLGLAESSGGVGFGAAEEALVYEVVGADLAPVGLAATTLAAHALHRAGAGEPLCAVLEGRIRVGLADPWSWTSSPPDASPLDGTAPLRVTDAQAADLLLCVGPGAVAVIDATDLEWEPCESFDAGTTVGLTAPSQPTVLAETADPDLVARPSMLVAAMLGGVARAALDRTVDYAKSREAFGQPIGAFQAIKHRCADMAIRCDAADATVRLAAVELDAGNPDASLVHTARVIAGDAAIENCRAAIQTFGGLGFTAEAGLDRHLRRSLLLATLFGPTSWHSDQLLPQIEEGHR